METLVLLVVFGLVNFGLFFICGLSAISLPVRRRMPPLVIELLECPGCFGFWTGLALATLAVASGLVSLPPALHFAFKILAVLAGGVTSTASNLLLYSLSGIAAQEDRAKALQAQQGFFAANAEAMARMADSAGVHAQAHSTVAETLATEARPTLKPFDPPNKA